MLTKKSDDFSKDKHILCWSESTDYILPPASKSILFRIPNKQIEDFSNFTELGIANSEVCFIYSQGKLDGPHYTGLYDFSPELLEGGSTIFILSTAIHKWKIEVPEDIKRAIGMNVDLSQFTVSFNISSPDIFITRGLDYSWEIDSEKAYTWISSLIVSSIGDISRSHSPEEVELLINDATRNQELISLIQSELDLMGVSISELSTGATISEGALEDNAMSSIGAASSTIMRGLEKLDDSKEPDESLLEAMASVSDIKQKKEKPSKKRKRSKAKAKEKIKDEVVAEPSPEMARSSIPPPSPASTVSPPPSPPGAGAAPAPKAVRKAKLEEPSPPPPPPSPMPTISDVSEEYDDDYEEEYEEYGEADEFGYAEQTYETTIIERETLISYYERMHVWKTFPLEVIISSEEIRATVVKNIARVKSKLEVEVEEDEKPIVRIVPIFPGCLISPIDAYVDLDDDFSQTIFYLTPTTIGKHKARVEFWKDEYKIGEEDIDLKVVRTRLAKISLTAGFGSLIPNVATAVGYDMNSAAEESISSKNDILSEIVSALGGMMFFLFALFIFFSSMSGIIFYLLRPKKDETSLSIF